MNNCLQALQDAPTLSRLRRQCSVRGAFSAELEKWDESAPPNRVKNEVPPGTRIIMPNGVIQKAPTAA
jgi:hypothetical protein